MMGAAGRDSSVGAGANSSPSHSAMRLLFEVCQVLVVSPVLGKRDSVARSPTVTIKSAIATKTAPPTAVAMHVPRRAAHRAYLIKPFTPDGTCPGLSRKLIIHQLSVDRKVNSKKAPQGRRKRKATRTCEAGHGEKVACTNPAIAPLGNLAI